MTRYRSRTIWAAILAATAALAASCGGGEQRSVEATPTVEATQIVTSTSTTRDTTVGSPASTTSAGGSSPSSTRAPTTTTSTAAPLQLGIQRIALPQDGRLEVAAIASSGEVHIAAGAIGYSGLTNAAILRSTDSINWERIPHVDSLFGAGVEDFAQAKAIEDVIWTGELFVAAGWERDADRKTDAAVWTSVDGTTWTAVANLGQFGGADLQRIEALVWADGIGIVAIGNDTLGQGSGGATWISVDGTEWERVDPDLAFPRRSGQAGFEDIAWSGDKFVAVGREIWTSSDGRVWEEVVGFQADFADFWDIQAVAYSTSVGFIAAGHAGDEADAYNEAIWRSDDGVAWELLPSPSAVDGSFNKRQIFDIAETPVGFVAVGVQNFGSGTPGQIWTSPDGDTWTRFAGDNEFLRQGALMTAVMPTDSGAAIMGLAESTALWLLEPSTELQSDGATPTTDVDTETATELRADFPESIDDLTRRWNERLDGLRGEDPTENVLKLLDLLQIGDLTESTLDDGGLVSTAVFVEGGFNISILSDEGGSSISLIRLNTLPLAMDNSEFNTQIFPIVRKLFAELIYGPDGFMVIDDIIAAQQAETLPINVDGVSWDAAGGIALDASVSSG